MHVYMQKNYRNDNTCSFDHIHTHCAWRYVVLAIFSTSGIITVAIAI